MNKSFLDHILRVRLPITLFVVIVSFAVTYFASRAERDGIGYSPRQPISFSHKLHAGQMNIDCQYCHTDVEKSRHAGIPAVETCMNCHRVSRKDRPQIQNLTSYYNEGRALQWKRVHKVPDFAYFNHSVHVNNGIACENCHGDVRQMDVITQVNSFTMAACLDCHRNAHDMMPDVKGLNLGPENCWACHR